MRAKTILLVMVAAVFMLVSNVIAAQDLVETVANGFPADKAGIERRDVIIEYDGEPVRDSAKFRLMVANTPVDKKVPLVVWRDGKTKKLTITVG